MSGRRARVVGVLAFVAIAVGVLTLVAARNEPVALAGGVRLWRLVHMNMVGSLLTLGAGVLGVVAWRRRSTGLALATGAMFSVLALATLVTLGSDANFTGGRGDTFAFYLAMALGPLAIALTPEVREVPEIREGPEA